VFLLGICKIDTFPIFSSILHLAIIASPPGSQQGDETAWRETGGVNSNCDSVQHSGRNTA
jgi:hypothetical protein